MEFVFVVPRIELFPTSTPHGIQLFGEGFLEAAFYQCVERHGFFVERDYAERTPSLKQVIPYTVVTRDGEVFLLQRTRGGGESRLHGKLSIGVGGHVNPVDRTGSEAGSPGRRDPIAGATHREISEELHVEGTDAVRSFGILNDDTNAVGAVHVGLVQVLSVRGRVAIRETDQLSGRFATLPELDTMLSEGANFETWSSLLIPHLGRLVPETVASPSR